MRDVFILGVRVPAARSPCQSGIRACFGLTVVKNEGLCKNAELKYTRKFFAYRYLELW